jgi:cytoskeletal protein RodZ
MDSIGIVLRTAREGKSISFDQVYSATRIHPRVLARLEGDDFDGLPSLCVRSFLRSYAGLLDVDAEPLLDAFYQREEKPLEGPGEDPSRPSHDRTIESTPDPSTRPASFVWPEKERSWTWDLRVLRRLGVVVGLPIALLGYLTYSAGKTLWARPSAQEAPRHPQALTASKSEASKASPAPSLAPAPRPQPTVESRPTPAPSATPESAAIARSARLRVTCNGRTVYDGLLSAAIAKDAMSSPSGWPKLTHFALEPIGKGAVKRVAISLSGSCQRM